MKDIKRTPRKGAFWWCTRWGFPIPLKGNPRKASEGGSVPFSRARYSFPCPRAPQKPTCRLLLNSPLRNVINVSFNGQLGARTVGFRLSNRYKKRPRKGAFWCTRWGSNPNSTASEAVMLSNYTTSTYEFFLFS